MKEKLLKKYGQTLHGINQKVFTRFIYNKKKKKKKIARADKVDSTLIDSGIPFSSFVELINSHRAFFIIVDGVYINYASYWCDTMSRRYFYANFQRLQTAHMYI